ncbi:unnamed protein product, partial [Rotaria sp. Silwood1]
ELNRISLGHILCDPSINATVRSLARAAHGEKVSLNDLAPGEFDLLLDGLPKNLLPSNYECDPSSNSDLDDDSLMRQVLAISQIEYVEILKK